MNRTKNRIFPSHPVNGIIHLFSGEAALQGYWAAFDQAMISSSNFIATLILARTASPTELGVYGVGFTALRLVRAVQDGVIIQPLNTHGASMNDAEFRVYASNTGVIQLILSIVTAIGAAILGLILTVRGNDIAGPGMYALWSVFLWWQLLEFIRRSLYTRGRIPFAVFNTTISNFVRLGIMLWWASQDQLTGIGSLIAIALGSLVGIFPGIWETKKYWTLKDCNLAVIWKKNWNFGRWILGSSTANWLAVEFYPVLTAGMVSFAAAGAYRALQNLVAPVFVLLKATDTFLTPRAAKIYDLLGMSALIRNIQLIYLLLGIPVGGILMIALLFPSFLLELFYGQTYLMFSNGAVWMVLFYLLLYLHAPALTALKAIRNGRPILLANLAAITAMFTLGVWLISNWGVYGTLSGQVINATVMTIILWTSLLTIIRNQKSGEDLH